MQQEQTEACSNCGALIPESKHMLHELYCQRNCKKCTACGRFYDLNDIESHEEEFHKNLNKQVPQKTQEPPKKQEVISKQPTTRTTQPEKKEEVVAQQFSRVKADEYRPQKQPEIKVPSTDIPQKFNNPSNIRAQVQEPQYPNRSQPLQQEPQYPNRNPSKFEEDQIRTIDKAQENYKSKLPTRPNQGFVAPRDNVPTRDNIPQRENNSGYGHRNAQEMPLRNYRDDQYQKPQREEPKKETESQYRFDNGRRPVVKDFNLRKPEEELSRKYTEDTKKKDSSQYNPSNKPNIDNRNSQPQSQPITQSNYQNKYTAKRDIDYAGNKETKQNVGYQAKKDIQEKQAPTKNLDRPGTAFARELQAQMNIESNVRPEDLGMTAEEFALYLSNEQSFNTQKTTQQKQPQQRLAYKPKAQQEFYDDDDQLQYAIQQSQQHK